MEFEKKLTDIQTEYGISLIGLKVSSFCVIRIYALTNDSILFL